MVGLVCGVRSFSMTQATLAWCAESIRPSSGSPKHDQDPVFRLARVSVSLKELDCHSVKSVQTTSQLLLLLGNKMPLQMLIDLAPRFSAYFSHHLQRKA
eukprot:4693559-Amphidinium_carterae.1